MADKGLDLTRTYLHFTEVHEIERFEVGPQFWSDLMTEKVRLTGRLVGSVRLPLGPLDHWERHPQGDEFLLLLSGRCTVILDEPAGLREVPLKAGEAFVVPKDVWHTFHTEEAGDLMFATAGDGTDHRPNP